MKATYTLCLLALALTGQAQNQVITPTGKPLIIGNQGGVKFSHLNASSPTQASNGKLLSVNDSGLLMLVPESAGGSSQWASDGNNISYVNGSVGVGTTTPLQRLDVNGNINMPSGASLRINNAPFLIAPGADNIFLGVEAGQSSTSGSGNTFLGKSAGRFLTSGTGNTFVGLNAGLKSTASFGVLIGTSAGQNNTTGIRNTLIGFQAGLSSTTGGTNVFVGASSGSGSSTGSFNVFVGGGAGSSNTTGSYNTCIGQDANVYSGALSNATAIGKKASVSASNSIVLGGTGVDQVNVGIGNTAPAARLHVSAGGTLVTGVRFENLPVSSGSVFGLFVDASGNLMRGTASSNARESAEGGSPFWIATEGGHMINANAGGVMIGSGLGAAPVGYKLYVSDGILTERIKVAVKTTADWRDNVLADDYRLRTVEEVAAFVKEHRHLPGVPTAREMVERGNDLHQTDALLLEKIEEMMLYIIELKKENTALKSEAAAGRETETEFRAYRATVQALLDRVGALEKK